MSALIERDFEFQAGLYFQNSLILNVYSFTLFMEVNTESVHEQNIAMDRVKYLIYEVLENAIFVHSEEKDIINKYKEVGLKVCALPEEPYDQIIALILLLKCDAICEKRLSVTDISLVSKLSDQVKFRENLLTAQSNYNQPSWWNNSSPTIEFNKTKNGKEKVVKIKNNEWKTFGLIWEEKKEKSTEIIFNLDQEK